MKEKTLLLNATYEPLRVISWERAISLYYLGKVEIVDTYERNILTQKVSMKIPAVVRVKRFVAFQRAYRHVKFSRQNVFTRDRYTCQYCGETQKGEHLTFDHVIPQCQGGETTFNNIVTACKPCNYKKAGRTPEEAAMPLRSRIYRPSWPLSISLMLALQTQIPAQWEPYLFGGAKGQRGVK